MWFGRGSGHRRRTLAAQNACALGDCCRRSRCEPPYGTEHSSEVGHRRQPISATVGVFMNNRRTHVLLFAKFWPIRTRTHVADYYRRLSFLTPPSFSRSYDSRWSSKSSCCSSTLLSTSSSSLPFTADSDELSVPSCAPCA